MSQFAREFQDLLKQYWNRLFVPAALYNLECLLGPGGYLEKPARERLRDQTPTPSKKPVSYPARIKNASHDPQAAVDLISTLNPEAWAQTYRPDPQDPFDATALAINSLNTILCTLTTAYPNLAKR